jgi:hypothetical protein
VQQDQEKEERQLEDTTPKHVGIRVKIKKEKEKSFKDLNNERWLRDLEIEVTNTGTKPIYFLDLRLHLPDMKGPDGNIIGWPLLYGRTDLVSVTEPLRPTDVPLKPGETHVFTIAGRFVSAWEGMERDGQVTQPKKVQVVFQLINFGDGTGFWGGTAAPLPHPKKASRNAPFVNGETNKERRPLGSRLVTSTTRQSTLSNISPAFVLANFFVSSQPNPITVDAGSAPDICCAGTSCTWAKQTFTRCQCSSLDDPEVNDAPAVTFPGCSDSSGACSTITYSTRWCDFPMGEGRTIRLSCSVPFVFGCGDFAPPPPPTPTPGRTSPTPTPTPTPTPACATPTPLQSAWRERRLSGKDLPIASGLARWVSPVAAVMAEVAAQVRINFQS